MFSDYSESSKEQLLEYIKVLESIVMRIKVRNPPIFESIIFNEPLSLDIQQKIELLKVLRKYKIASNED